jgi:hypothetical protein
MISGICSDDDMFRVECRLLCVLVLSRGDRGRAVGESKEKPRLGGSSKGGRARNEIWLRGTRGRFIDEEARRDVDVDDIRRVCCATDQCELER